MQTIEQFCNRHNACRSGREWALTNCNDMLHAWQTTCPKWRIWIATRPGVLTDRELRLFAVHCARSVQHLMTDPRSIAAIDVAERHANGQATDKELAAVRAAASDAAWSASWATASDAAWSASWATARDAARAAAWAASWDAARDAGWDAGWDAVRAAAEDAQSAWLLENTTPNFEAP
jgi:hypothetical protein